MATESIAQVPAGADATVVGVAVHVVVAKAAGGRVAMPEMQVRVQWIIFNCDAGRGRSLRGGLHRMYTDSVVIDNDDASNTCG